MAKEPDDGKVGIELLVTKEGLGKRGDKLRVSSIRAQRWFAEGLCQIPGSTKQLKQEDPPGKE